MGYKRARKRYLLKFEDPEMEGFEITMSSLSIGEFTHLTGVFSAVSTTEVTQETVAANAGGVSELLEKFSASIVGWNLEDEAGEPVPATYDGVKTQDLDFIMEIVMAWMDAIAGVDPTLPASANGGGTSPEALLPMEPLSLSLPN